MDLITSSGAGTATCPRMTTTKCTAVAVAEAPLTPSEGERGLQPRGRWSRPHPETRPRGSGVTGGDLEGD